MDNKVDNSYRDTRAQNVAQKRYITVVFSQKSIETPFPFRCIGCGFIVFMTNNFAKAVIDGMLRVEDIDRSTDHICRHCKLTYRVT